MDKEIKILNIEAKVPKPKIKLVSEGVMYEADPLFETIELGQSMRGFRFKDGSRPYNFKLYDTEESKNYKLTDEDIKWISNELIPAFSPKSPLFKYRGKFEYMPDIYRPTSLLLREHRSSDG